MTWWWLVPVGAMAVGALVAATGVRRLRAGTAGLAGDAAAVAAAGADAAALTSDIAALRDRLDRFPGTGPGPGGR